MRYPTLAAATGILTAALVGTQALAAVTVFENDRDGWLAGAATTLIDFESVPGSATPLAGDEFAGFAGSPTFTGRDDRAIFVGNPTMGQVTSPPSGVNMFHPLCDPSCEGVVVLTFSQAVTRIGAVFIDVEADFALTGFSLDVASDVPEFAFSSPQGQGAFSFLGLVSDDPFTRIAIHFATGPNIDGVLIDDLEYAFADDAAAIPVPAAAPLLLTGGAFIAAARRRRQTR